MVYNATEHSRKFQNVSFIFYRCLEAFNSFANVSKYSKRFTNVSACSKKFQNVPQNSRIFKVDCLKSVQQFRSLLLHIFFQNGTICSRKVQKCSIILQKFLECLRSFRDFKIVLTYSRDFQNFEKLPKRTRSYGFVSIPECSRNQNFLQ